MLNTMQTNKCLGIFNRHLIALNIEQMTVITRMSRTSATTAHREGVYEYGTPTCVFVFRLIYRKMVKYYSGEKGTFNL